MWQTHVAQPCLIYVLRDGTAYKFGKANSVYERADTLQCGNPRALGLVLTFPGGHELETRFHRWLRPVHIRGEWFEDGPEVQEALRFAEELRDKLYDAWDGGEAAPEWKGLMTWPRYALRQEYRKKREHAPVTVRRVDPATLK